MLITLICICLCLAIFAAAYYGAYRMLSLKQDNVNIANELKQYHRLVEEMDERIQQLEFERDQGMREAEMKGAPTGKTSGWSVFEGRGN